MPDLEEIQKQLASLRAKFANGLAPRIEQLITDIGALASQSDPAHELQEVFRKIHSLSGSAGTFGFNRLSQQSRQLELILSEFINNNSLPDSKTIDNLNHGLEKLYPLISEGPDDIPSNNASAEPPSMRKKNGQTVYLLSDDSVHSCELCHQLNENGFTTRLFPATAEVLPALEQEIPEALILDFDLSEKLLKDTEFKSRMHQLFKQDVSCLFISSRQPSQQYPQQDWNNRLAAVRAGGSAYLDKPVDISLLLDHLDRVTQRAPRKPYRVLVVDDTRELVQYYSLVLRQAGMSTETITEPADILIKLESFHPELILLDFYFPEISGLEIAQVLHQHPVYFNIPIIFLSTETNPDIKLKMLQQADYVLEKPVLDNELVRTVASRIERNRIFSQHINHDKLIGLPG